jgi:nucleolar protein 56
MADRLLTTWYGSFLMDGDGKVRASAPFPRSAEEIANRLRTIREGHVLDEERKISPREGTFQVLEDRLATIQGATRVDPGPSGPFPPAPESLGFLPDLLRSASLELASTAIRGALPTDQPVVLYLRAMDLVEKEGARAFEMLRYWHSFHFPELGALVDDETLLQLVSQTPDRTNLLVDRPDLDTGLDTGRPLVEGEGLELGALAAHILAGREEGRRLKIAVEETILKMAPNLAAVAGPLVGARLLSLAGSLDRLARMPSSTVQLLGAERALFLHIKEGTPPPKHGVVFQHPSVHSAPPWLRGRIARSLAGKISIAARGDMVGSSPDGELGATLREQFLKRTQQLRKDHPDPPPGWRKVRPQRPSRGRPKGRRGHRPGKKRRGKGRSKGRR